MNFVKTLGNAKALGAGATAGPICAGDLRNTRSRWLSRDAMRFGGVFLLLLMLALLQGCGGRKTICDPDPSYYGRKDGRALTVPDDLDIPQETGRYNIPAIGQGNAEVDPVCGVLPPRVAGLKDDSEREERRRKRAAQRDQEAREAAQAASDAMGGTAASPNAPVPIPTVVGDELDAESGGYAEVYDAVAEWSRAWEERDLEGYLSAYSAGFQPPQPMTRAQWEEVREKRMNGGARAVTDMETLQVFETDEGGLIARFEQAFSFETIESRLSKELYLVRERRGEWLIVTEEVVSVQ